MRSGYCVFIALLLRLTAAHAAERWTEAKANAWYRQQPWLVGANYVPATSINQLEMWQEATFDPARIDLELGWAESISLRSHGSKRSASST